MAANTADPLVQLMTIGRTPTHVVSASSFAATSKSTNILVVPGSPGIGQLYVPFVKQLYSLCRGKANVSAVSHAGHSPGHYREDATGRRWHSLHDQVKHKMTFVKDQMPPKSPIVLIGHSIGCHVILQMLEKLEPERVKKVVLLFPTIERMHESPAGKRFIRFSSSALLKKIFMFFICLFSLLPNVVKKLLLTVRFVFTPSQHRKDMVEGVTSLINSKSMENIVGMAEEEMEFVRELDSSTIRKFSSRICMYYGIKDHWVPDDAFGHFKGRFPSVRTERCRRNFEHAFLLKNSNEMAMYVYEEYIKECL